MQSRLLSCKPDLAITRLNCHDAVVFIADLVFADARFT